MHGKASEIHVRGGRLCAADVFNHSRITTVVVLYALTSNLDRAKEPGNVLLDRVGSRAGQAGAVRAGP